MKRVLPFPIVSAGLFILWLLLNQNIALGQIFLGGIIGLVGGWALAALQPPKPRLRRLGAIFHLGALVLTDIARSNFAVAGIILGLQRKTRTSGFVEIPLELRDPYGLATLACIITATPGTLWVDFDAGSGTLTIHVLDLIDKSEWVHTIKGRYESLLREIFT